MDFAQFFATLKERYSKLTSAQRTSIIVLAAAVLVSTVMLYQWATKVEYAPLMKNLSDQDASKIVAKLKELKIVPQLADNGSTILVPKTQVDETRLQLAGSGVLPGGGTGFELFDQTKLGATDFERRINYQRALEGELRRTINTIGSIEDSRIHLVLPEKSLFLEDAKSASASVVLKLKPFAKLTPDEVRGIIFLVSSAVENLKPQDVRVIDTDAMVLSDEVDLGVQNGLSTQVSVKQQEFKKQYEKEMEKRIKTMLETVLGSGKAVAMVSSDIDFSSKETNVVDYAYNRIALRSEQTVKDQATSGDAYAVGPAGNQSNVTLYPAANTGQTQSAHNHSEDTRNYEVPQTQEKILQPPGNVTRLSAAVIVDGPLSPAKTDQIKQIVSAAMGYSPDRKDQISVTSMAFDKSETEAFNKEITDMESKKRLEEYVRWSVIALGLLLTFILGIVYIRKKYAPQDTSAPFEIPFNEMPAFKDVEVQQVVPLSDGTLGTGQDDDALEEEAKKVFKPTPEKKRQNRAKGIVADRPEEVAQLIKAWLNEE